jgi:hypothetical protein
MYLIKIQLTMGPSLLFSITDDLHENQQNITKKSKVRLDPKNSVFYYNIILKYILTSDIHFISRRVSRLEHLHHSSVSRWRPPKGIPVPVGITGPPSLENINTGTWSSRLGVWHKSDKLLLRNPKKWKPDQIWQNFLRKAVAQKVLFCQWWWWWWI